LQGISVFTLPPTRANPVSPKSSTHSENIGFSRYLPSRLRREIVRRHLGPAAAWHLAPRIRDNVSTMLNSEIIKAEGRDGGVELTARSKDGSTTTVQTDHAIVATGYRTGVDRLSIIENNLRSRIRKVGRMSHLSRNFESSIPGLYFVGNATAGSFGPLMRFAYGCEFTAHRVSRHVISQ